VAAGQSQRRIRQAHLRSATKQSVTNVRGEKNRWQPAAKAKEKMIESKLPSAVLHRIWTLSDRDEDGMLALGEYAIAMRLTEMKLRGLDLPVTLPENIISEIED